MKKLKKILASPVVTVAAFGLAVGLLLFSSVNGARAALSYFSEDYNSRIELSQIGVALVENDNLVPAGGKLLTELLTGADGAAETLKPGKLYEEELCVQNTGSIDQYVRVRIYRYWTDGSGEKSRELSPEMIRLWLGGTVLDVDPEAEQGYLAGDEALKDAYERSLAARAALEAAGWLVDEGTLSRERLDLYYTRMLSAGDPEAGVTSLFADQLSIDGAVAAQVSETEEVENRDGAVYRTITRTYAYDGHDFCLEVKVDAVQDHNAEDAALSAWGRAISIDDGILSLR